MSTYEWTSWILIISFVLFVVAAILWCHDHTTKSWLTAHSHTQGVT